MKSFSQILALSLALAAPLLAQQLTVPTRPVKVTPQIAVQPYNWRLPRDQAGGNCTGFAIHPLDSSVRYVASGDTGGYRWNTRTKRWTSFTDWNADFKFGYMVGMALDPRDKNVLYYAAGNRVGEIFKSVDGAQTFVPAQLKKPDGKPVFANGLEDASPLGEVLVVDPANPDVIYYASRIDGLYRSLKAAAPASFGKIESFTARGDVLPTFKIDGQTARGVNNRNGLSFVAIDGGSGTVEVGGVGVSKTIYLGVSGDRRVQTQKGGETTTLVEGGVWRSNDGGQTWTHLGGPNAKDNNVARGYVASDGTLYASVSGRVCRVRRGENAVVDLGAPADGPGYFALAIDPRNPKHIVASRYGLAARENSYDTRNLIVRTLDGGATWTPLKAQFDSPGWWNWFFSYNHWLMFDPNGPVDESGRTKEIWGGDWIGPWQCLDISAAQTRWDLHGEGRGGTYVISIATPPSSPSGIVAPLYIHGADFDGFRFNSLSSVPRKRLTQSASGVNDGVADGTNIAFCESDPRFMAAVGGWDHGQFGGGGASTDGGLTWRAFEGRGLNHPGTGRDIKLGRVAVSSTKQENGWPILVWIPRFNAPRFSLDFGKTWTESTGAPRGMTPSEWEPWQTLVADPVEGKTFYALDNNTSKKDGAARIWKSIDGGATWNLVGGIKASWQERLWSEYHLRATPGKSGDLWLSLVDLYTRFPEQEPAQGLFHSRDGGANWTRVEGMHPIRGLAFGAPAPNRTNPSMVVGGRVGEREGIFVSDDATSLENPSVVTWKQVWDHKTTDQKAIIHNLKSLGADRQVYGRVYAGSVSTGRGVYFGDVPTTGAPHQVRNLEAFVDFDGVRLNWTDPIGATKFNVYRAAGSEKPQLVQTLDESAFHDTNLKSSVVYSYAVEAVNAAGKSAISSSTKASALFKVAAKSTFGSTGRGQDTVDKAFDGDLKTAFDAVDGLAFAGFDAGETLAVTRLRFQPREWMGKRMIGGKFQGSSTKDGPWTDIFTLAKEPMNGVWTSQTLEQPATFRFFRYLGPSGGHGNVKEIEFYSGGAVR